MSLLLNLLTRISPAKALVSGPPNFLVGIFPARLQKDAVASISVHVNDMSERVHPPMDVRMTPPSRKGLLGDRDHPEHPQVRQHLDDVAPRTQIARQFHGYPRGIGDA
jgi:putative aminopeptidase FrvX